MKMRSFKAGVFFAFLAGVSAFSNTANAAGRRVEVQNGGGVSNETDGEITVRYRGILRGSGEFMCTPEWKILAGPKGEVSFYSKALLDHFANSLRSSIHVHTEEQSGYGDIKYSWEPWGQGDVGGIRTQNSYTKSTNWPQMSSSVPGMSDIQTFISNFTMPPVGETENCSKWKKLEKQLLNDWYDRPMDGAIDFNDAFKSSSSGEFEVVLTSSRSVDTAQDIQRQFLIIENAGGSAASYPDYPKVRTLTHTFHLDAGKTHSDVLPVNETFSTAPPSVSAGEYFYSEIWLVPYEFTEVNPESGFDGETQPNWLMVPKDQQNWTKAITPAHAGMELKFKIIPTSGGASVSPDSTSQSPETLTVSSPNLGDDSSLVIGVGTAFGTEGLKLSVKKYQTKTVAIHAVTQKYASDHYMPLNPNANPPEGIASVVCVRPKPDATIIGATTPGGDDHKDPDSGVIDTGSNGVCETNADAQYDEQVIPNGQGVHKDIAPQYVPTDQELQTFLNNVFGPQTNTYFTVTRSDKSVDFDILKNANDTYNKALDMSGTSDFTEEEKILRDQVKSSADFNVYYVHNYHFGNSVGKAVDDVAYMKDFDSRMQEVMWCTSHELGHCFGLWHSEMQKLYDFPSAPVNPTYIPNSNPNKRLMYGRTLIENIKPRPKLLIKSEWDVINPKP